MQNDERDEREPRDEHEQQEDWPQPDRREADEANGGPSEGDAAEEFETPAWPQQDSVQESQPDGEPLDEAIRESRSGPDASPPQEPEWERPGEPEPPPPDVEAHSASMDATEPVVPAHSVPATEPGESTRCPRCGTENRPGISFCRSCGQRLVAAGAPSTVARPSAPEGTQACPRCGTHNRAGVAFCQNCGANLRAAAEGYVPPAVAGEAERSGRAGEAGAATGRALLGPIVLIIGAIGLVTAWLLPFAIGDDSLFDQAWGSDGYGIAAWSGADAASGIAEQIYYLLAAASPILVALLVVLAIAGFLRPAPAVLQRIGLAISLIWALGLVALFVVVELIGGPGGELLDILRALSPAGIIFMLASLIVLIGALTRFGRG